MINLYLLYVLGSVALKRYPICQNIQKKEKREKKTHLRKDAWKEESKLGF